MSKKSLTAGVIPAILLFFIILSLSVSGRTFYGVEYDAVFSDDFEYVNTFSSQKNYSLNSLTTGCSNLMGNTPFFPQNGINFSNSLGFGLANDSNFQCTNENTYIGILKALNPATGQIIASFQLGIGERYQLNNTQGEQIFYIRDVGVSNFNLKYNPQGTIQEQLSIDIGTSLCYWGSLEKDVLHNITMIVDTANKKMSLAVDGDFKGCSAVSFTDNFLYVDDMLMRYYIGGNNVSTFFFDNLFIGTTQANITYAVGSYPQNYPCNNNTQCDSGLCYIGFCALKTGGLACDSNSECLSGSCVGNICTNAGVATNIKYGIGQIFGFDTFSYNFLSFILILITFVAIMISGTAFSFNNKIVHIPLTMLIAVSCVICVFEMIVLTFIGMLSGWILLLVFVFGVIATFIILMLKSNAGQG